MSVGSRPAAGRAHRSRTDGSVVRGTWSVNSLTHLFGYRNCETSESSRNNWFVGVVALGEGWHNNHHHDPAAASVWHRWWEFDLTYCVILMLKRLGLATKVIEPKMVRHTRRV
jgi:fatty-acid desaturase